MDHEDTGEAEVKDQSALYAMSTIKGIVHVVPMTFGEYMRDGMKNANINPDSDDKAFKEKGYSVTRHKGTDCEMTQWIFENNIHRIFQSPGDALTPNDQAKIHMNCVQYELKEKLIAFEKELAEQLAEAFENPKIDPRWKAIARTHFDQGFLALRQAFDEGMYGAAELSRMGW